MATRAPRLPGFRFETQAPPLPETLPRMDIAVFVGFAASGPLDIPVAVESEAHFTAIFGDDAPLAWDFDRGEQLFAYLGPAVRAFFRNNGRRCWVIRVAKRTVGTNRARYNYFPVSGLAHIEFDQAGNKKITPAFARARSEGSWSDRLQVSSALLSTPVVSQGALNRISTDYSISVAPDALNSLHTGDLLRMDFANGQFAFLGISKAELATPSPPSSPLSHGPALEVHGSNAVWFESVKGSDVPATPTFVSIWLFRIEGVASPPHKLIDTWVGIPHTASLSAPEGSSDGTLQVELSGCAPSDAPLPGSLVRVDFSSQQWWMAVETVTLSADAVPVILGKAFRAIETPDPLPFDRPKCCLLTLEIWVRKDDEYSISLGDLGFTDAHDRYWARLPIDEQVYDDPDPLQKESPATILWRQVGDLFRFPLAGPAKNPVKSEFYVPLSVGALPENYLGAVKLPGTALERDGLAKFNEKLFLDRDLTRASLSELAGQAEYLTYLSPQPRKLAGIHAAFALEEATLICVPDAVHRGWTSLDMELLPSPAQSSPPIRPDWWHFLDCDEETASTSMGLSDCDPPASPPSKIKGVHEPLWANFTNCSIEIIPAPELFVSTQISSDGTFVVLWNPASPADNFILEESSADDFLDAAIIYSGASTTFTIYGRKPGDFFYRVRSFVGDQSSDWSNTEFVRVGEVKRWALKPNQDYSPDVLLAIQRSALRLCGARGDLVCLLSLPEHYREDATIEHARLLRATPNLAPVTNGVSPLGLGEANALSYGALFHPWLIEREEELSDRLVLMPPCGAVCGLFSDRANNRGAWIAPANQAFRGVVSLEPALDSQRRLDLQEAHINLLRQEPRGFIVLDADTLSDDVDLRLMNIRRLLILLRRQALKLGATYVFEPNSPAFRRMVDRGFNDMLDGLFERGAFAGNNPATSYQVVTDESLNTPESVDQGRFIVELRVAPSLPMSFLTIRLVQTSERSLATEVR